MKELIKSKGMWLLVVFIFIVLFIGINDNTKNVSAENTNNQTISQK